MADNPPPRPCCPVHCISVQHWRINTETRSARALHSEDSNRHSGTANNRPASCQTIPTQSKQAKHNPDNKSSPGTNLSLVWWDVRRCGEDGLALTQRLLVAPLLPASAGIDRCSHRRRSWKTAARGSARRWKAATARLAGGGLDVPHICCTPAPCIALHHPAGAFHSSSGMPSPPHRRLRHTAGATSVNLFVAFGL